MLLAAQTVLLLHCAFLALVVFGGLLVWWRWHWRWLHLPALAWGVWIETSHGICPLTRLENHLLHQAGASGYGGGFIEHYLMPILYPPGLLPVHQQWLALALIVFNGLCYSLAWRRSHSPSTGAAP